MLKSQAQVYEGGGDTSDSRHERVLHGRGAQLSNRAVTQFRGILFAIEPCTCSLGILRTRLAMVGARSTEGRRNVGGGFIQFARIIARDFRQGVEAGQFLLGPDIGTTANERTTGATARGEGLDDRA